MSEAKAIRKQIRNVAQDIVKDLITNELLAALEKRIMEKVNARLDLIDSRQKDIQMYMIKQNSKG